MSGRLFQRQRQAKVQHARPHVRANEHIVRLEVAMNEPLPMGDLQGARHFASSRAFWSKFNCAAKRSRGKPCTNSMTIAGGSVSSSTENTVTIDGMADRGGVARFLDNPAVDLFVVREGAEP